MRQTILHITDLHIFSPTDNLDLFNEKNYQKYLNDLISSIKTKCDKIDALIITGDFVDVGKVENFAHADIVIQHIIKQLGLKEANVGVCIGNHDIKCRNEKGEVIDDERSHFDDFAKKYSISNKLVGHEFFHLTKLSDHLYFLSLDATYGRKDNKPGKLTNERRRQLINLLSSNLPDHPNNLLIVGSHYPMTSFFEDSLNHESFFDSGLWQSAMPLFSHIKSQFKQSKLLWLFGDLHYPDYLVEEDGRSIAVLSGRIGIHVPDYDSIRSLSIADYKGNEIEFEKKTKKFIAQLSQQPRMATVIQYYDDQDTSLTRFKFVPNGHEDSLDGHWESYDGRSVKHPYNVPEIIPFPSYESNQDDYDPSSFDVEENPIMKTIIDQRLYKFGRFSTRDNEISLGWVPLNDVLGDRLIFSEIINSSREWLAKVLQTGENETDKTLIVGVDFWGSVIASQLSIMTGFKNHCRASASFGQEDDYVVNERFCEGLNLSNEKNIVIVTDVVSSGRTINTVYNKIKSYFDTKNLKIEKVICIAALCDRNQDRKVKLDFLTRFGTLCGDIRIPIVDKGFLPDEKLVPSQKIYT